MLTAAGVEDRLKQFPSKMSGEQQQNLSIARVSLREHEVLFAALKRTTWWVIVVSFIQEDRIKIVHKCNIISYTGSFLSRSKSGHSDEVKKEEKSK